MKGSKIANLSDLTFSTETGCIYSKEGVTSQDVQSTGCKSPTTSRVPYLLRDIQRRRENAQSLTLSAYVLPRLHEKAGPS